MAERNRPLTPRERQVLSMLTDGHTNLRIAERLGLSQKTVESHRRHVGEKVGTRRVALLTKYAIRTGLTRL